MFEFARGMGGGVGGERGQGVLSSRGYVRGNKTKGFILKRGVWFYLSLLLFITAVPNTKLCAWGEEDSGGHVLRLIRAEAILLA